MRRFFFVFISLVQFSFISGQSEFRSYLNSLKNTVVEEHIIFLDNDKIKDTILCKFPLKTTHPEFGFDDPGEYKILDLRLSRVDDIYLDKAFDTLPKKPFKKYSNEINSQLVFLSDFNHAGRFLFLATPSYGCCIEELYIFSVSSNQFKLIYDGPLSLIEILDFDGDGNIEIIGFDTRGEDWGSIESDFIFTRLTYPKVFKVTNSIVHNEELTYRYNSKLTSEFGRFQDFHNPIIVESSFDKSKTLVEYDSIGKYNRSYKF